MGNHPPKFGSKRFSGCRERTCAQMDGRTGRVNNVFFFVCINANMLKRIKSVNHNKQLKKRQGINAIR